MSFCNQEDIIKVSEELVNLNINECGYEIPEKFERIPTPEAMEKYGSDKPDLRYDLANW